MGVIGREHQGVVGRDHELGVVAEFLENRDSPGILLVEGEPGIGKTTVWRAGIEQAEQKGFHVLACSGAESEAQLSFTALRDLLGLAFDEIAHELPGPQRTALAVTLLREEPPVRPLDLGTINVAFLGALHRLGARSRLLVAIDDVQWLERASAAVLAYALRRHEHAPFAMLLARRAEYADALALDRLESGRLETIELGALTIGALGRILHERLGVAYPRPTLQRLADVSGGNPFFALELARALGHRAHALAPDEPLPVPPTLRELVTTRLATLPEETLDVLAYAAALSRPVLATVGSAAGLDPLPPLDPAIAAHVVDIRGDIIHFAHPLFAAGVYERLGPLRRRYVHARLAEVVDDVEERARHLALARELPDEEVASVLEGAARRSRIRGDRVVSAQLFQDAARLTPDENVSRRARRMLAGAGALFEAGDSQTARALLEQVVDSPGAADTAAEARWRLGTVLAETGSGERAMQLWHGALESAQDPSLAADIQRSMAVSTIYAGDADAAVGYAEGALAAAEASAEPERIAFALSTRALTAAVAGDPTYRAFVDRALALESGLDLPSSAWSPSAVAGECALLALDVEQARAQFSAVLAQAVEAGNVEMELWASHRLATAQLAAGDAQAARELAEVVAELAETTGLMRLPAARLSAELDAHFGRSEEARERLEIVAAEARREGWNRHLWLTQNALGALHLARADAEAAADYLLAARRLASENGMRNAAVLVPIADEVEAAVDAGRIEQAEHALATMRGFRDVPSWAEPLLLRAQAALLAARGELGEAETALDRASAQEAIWVLPLQRARTLLALGECQRRARRRRAARETLQQALAIFDDLGTPLWAAKARAELARIGGRAPSGDALTPAEQRIAELVARGLTNKEVAAELVVSIHTVESALTQAYRKLGVRSRSGLARKFAESA